MSQNEENEIAEAFRKSMRWTAAQLANDFLMNFTDPWPEEDAADLYLSALAAKREELNKGRS